MEANAPAYMVPTLMFATQFTSINCQVDSLDKIMKILLAIVHGDIIVIMNL